MYPYNYNIPQNKRIMYKQPQVQYQNDERFVGGLFAPLLLGGVAGYAIGQNNRPNYGYYYPQPYYNPYPTYYSNNYYYNPYQY